MSAASQETLVALLREAGRAHHDAFADVGGDDPDWPRWYAAYLAPRLGAGAGLDAAALARALVEAEADRKSESPDAEWPGYTAGWLLAHVIAYFGGERGRTP
jgi:hypothetical protein